LLGWYSWWQFAGIAAAVFFSPFVSPAVTISSGPSFTPAGLNAPLAGVLQLNTDVPTRVSVSVNDGTNNWTRDFLDYATVHSNMLVGFKAGRSNAITVSVRDKYRNVATAPQALGFVTDPLPTNFPTIVLLQSNTNKMEPGYTLFRGLNQGSTSYIIILDKLGEVVWYSPIATVLDVRQLPNGDLFYPTTFAMNEINLLGQTVQTTTVPTAWRVDSHDGVPTDHGTILYMSNAGRTVTNFPTSSTDPNAPKQTTNVNYQPIIEISATNAPGTNAVLLNAWHPIDMLDPLRIDYLTFSFRNSFGWDWDHGNAVLEDWRDGSIINSMRHQDAVVKFTRAGQIKWILGPHENWGPAFQQYLLTPVGTPFAWNYAQHAPKVTPRGTILMYDDGDFRASPFDASITDSNNYSRAVEFSVDETNMTVSQVWEYTSTNEPLYTSFVGDTDWLSQRTNILVTFGGISYVNHVRPSTNAPGALMVRIKEVTHAANPEVVWDLMMFDYSNTNKTYQGCFTYRSDRIPDLYSVTPQAVVDLSVTRSNGQAHLAFSGSALRTYAVQASSNLVNWDLIGTATPSANGNLDFFDSQAGALPARYYRVVTQ
jgi:hypothetical protein